MKTCKEKNAMKPIGLLKNQTTQKSREPANPIITEEDFTHCAIVGQTGCGKTSAAILPNIDRRIAKGHAVLVYDYKGNMHDKVKAIAARHNRLDDVVMLGVPWGKSLNLIESLTESEIEKMLAQMMGHEKEKFWQRSGLDIAMPIIALLRKIDELKRVLEAEDMWGNFSVDVSGAMVRYDLEPSLQSLYRITTSTESLKNFVRGYEELYSELMDMMGDFVNSSSASKGTEPWQRRLVDVLNRLDENMTLHAKYKDMPTDRYSTYSSIHLSLVGGLSAIASQKIFNCSEISIADSLESGAIVILNTQSLAPMALAFLTQSLFEQLKIRFIKPTKQPVSIFIDEAQKVLNEEMEIPIDTMREAKVEVFMAFQNASLIVRKIGQEGYDALHTNLTKKFVFRSDRLFDEKVDTSSYETFEYAANADRYQTRYLARRFEISADECFEAERSYQERIALSKRYRPESRRKEPFILVYEPRIFEQGRIIVQNKTGDSKIVPFTSEVSLEQTKELLDAVECKNSWKKLGEEDKLYKQLNELLGS